MDSEGGPAVKLRELQRLTYDLRWAGTKDEEGTMANASSVVARLGPEKPVAKLSSSQLQDLQLELRRTLAPSTVNRKLAALSGMLRVARERGLTNLKTPPQLKEPKGRVRVLSGDEWQQLCFTLAGLSPEAYRLSRFLMETGMRVREALTCRIEGTEEAILESYGGAPAKVVAVLADSKNGKPRIVPLTEKARACVVGDWPPKITQRDFNKAWKTARELCGIDDPEVVPHCLRHTCATRLVRSGVPLPIVQRWLGHSSLRMTERYVHVDDADLEQAREALEAL